MSNFQTECLSNVCEILMGQAPNGDSYNTLGMGYPLIAGAGDFGEFNPEPKKYTNSPTKLSQPGDLILCIRATIGDRNWSDKVYCLGRGVAGLRAKNAQLSQAYLGHWIDHAGPTLRAKGRGATFLQVSKGDIASLQIPLPPLAEQKRIAAILDAADVMRTKRREALALLDTLLQSTFLDMFGDPVTNPMGWKRCKLGEIINFVGGSQPPKDTFTYELTDQTIRLVQIRDFKSDKWKTYIPKELARRLFEEDDVMIARYGPPVFQILTGLSGSYNVALMKAEPIGEIEKRFIFHLLSHPSVNKAVVTQSERTAGQTGVNLKFLNNYPAYHPPIDLQRRFAAIVESVERQKTHQRAHLAELDTLFASLQQRAFNGELSA